MRRKSSRFRWIVATVAPWALGTGLLVSFTASAGIPQDVAWSRAERDIVLPESLVSPLPQAFIHVAHQGPLAFPIARRIDPLITENPPRAQMKTKAVPFPTVNRTAKGDQLVALKPSFSRRGGAGDLMTATLEGLMFQTEADPTTSVFTPGLDGAEWDGGRFEPAAPGTEGQTNRVLGGASSPAAGSAGASPRGPIISVDGATPATPKAVVLSSATPAPADAIPVEIAAAPVSLPALGLRRDSGTSQVAKSPAAPSEDASRPSYASLIDPQAMSREQRCLAEAVYFEARSETEEGQAAVAQVVLNRVKSGLYPSTVCGVVYQNRHRHLACQFTFACEGKALRITEAASWAQAVRVAREVTEGKTYLSDVGGATHYHADYVRPYWAKRLKKMDVIGRHIFYKLKPGQT